MVSYGNHIYKKVSGVDRSGHPYQKSNMTSGTFLCPEVADTCQILQLLERYFKYQFNHIICYSNLSVDDVAHNHWLIHATSEQGNITLIWKGGLLKADLYCL